MADFIFVVVVIIGFFALAVAYVLGCSRIVDGDFDETDQPTEVTS